jgi:ubiquinone biosynthesis protein COQ4
MKKALGALSILFRDPNRLDQVLVFALNVNIKTVARSLSLVMHDPEGRRLLADQPRIDRVHVDFAALERLPDGTLGREYARFLSDNGISPEPFEALPDVGDERAAYLMLRMRQTHDLWHVLTGYRPDVRGELLLQAFTYAQIRAPSALLIATLGSLRYGLRLPGHARDLLTAYRRGKAARFLPTFRWEERWATPVAELREELACPRAA